MANKKILVVDDAKANLALLSAVLRPSSYDVVTSITSVGILDLIAKEQPDLVLLDVLMPGVTGLDALHMIRENEDTKNLPVIMVSANVEANTISKAYELGASDYVNKPIIIPQLLKAIKNQLG